MDNLHAATDSRPYWEHPWILAVALAGAILLTYSNCWDVPFQYDDNRNIVEHNAIRSLVLTPADGENEHFRRPVGRWSLWLNYSLHRLDVRGYHVLNVAVHIAAALALFGLVRRTLRMPMLCERFGRDADRLALAIAIVWALHPLQSQSVTYIIQRFESLMGLFFLLTLYCLARTRTSPRPWLWQLGAIAAGSLSIGSKEVGAMAPLVALAFDRVFLTSSWKELLRRRGWMYLGFLPVLIWFATGMTPQTGQYERLSKGVTAWEYFRSQPGVILHYLRLTFWPDTLVLDYGWPVAQQWVEIVLPGLILSALLIASLVALWKRPAAGFLGLSFFLILAPTSSVLPIQDLAFEHRMYLPLASIASLVMGVGYALLRPIAGGRAIDEVERHAQTRRLSFAAVGVVLIAVALAARTHLRNEDWRDPLRLWAQNVKDAPQSYRAWGNLAKCLLDRGQVEPAGQAIAQSIALKELPWSRAKSGAVFLAAGQPAQALREYQRSYELKPEVSSLLGQGKCFQLLGQSSEAERVYRLAVERKADSAGAHAGLARALADLGRDGEAIIHFQAATAADSNDPLYPLDFGTFYALRGKFDEAIAQFEEAIRRRPDYAQAHLQLALAQYERGDLPAATQAAFKLLRLKPESQAGKQLLAKIEQRETEL